MKLTKKTILYSFIIAFTAFLAVSGILLAKNSQKVKASSQTEVLVESFLPASPVEFYDLNSPVAVSYSNDGYTVISEYSYDQTTNTEHNKLSVYNPILKAYVEFASGNGYSNITQIKKYGDFIYFAHESNIYYVSVNDLSATPKQLLYYDNDVNANSVGVSNYFDFNNGKLVANLSNTIDFYSLAYVEGEPFAQHVFPFKGINSSLGFYSNDGNVYFLSGSTLCYINPLVNIKPTTLTQNMPSIISMVDIGDYLYFTNSEGLFRLSKTLNSVPEKILSVTVNAKTLGHIRSPQGLTVKNGKLLITDNYLNCIQEFDITSLSFTTFAITTESTADFRLTYGASKICLSDNFVYVLDNSYVATEFEQERKRIVRISTDNAQKKYQKIDLSNIYEKNADFTLKNFVCSDTHILICDSDTVTLYKIIEGTPLTLEPIYTYDSSIEVTSVNYLDGVFYFLNTAGFGEEYLGNVTKITKIIIPSEDNELEEIKIETSTSEIPGIAIKTAVDVFGNVYVYTKTDLSSVNGKLIRYYNDTVNDIKDVNDNILDIQTDFNGYIYALTENNIVKKFVKNEQNYDTYDYILKLATNETANGLVLNYQKETAYILGGARVYKTSDNALDIGNLSSISAKDVNALKIYEEVKFVTVNKNAKLFKVILGNYRYDGDEVYFKDITPIANPNVTKTYLVISDLNDEYYLVSYSQKLVALVRKTSVSEDSQKFDANVINVNDYETYGIEVIEKENTAHYTSNQVKIYSRPMFDDNYNVSLVDKNTKIYEKKRITFNGKTASLVSLTENGESIGYIFSGYLVDAPVTPFEYDNSVSATFGENANRKAVIPFMILIIAVTLTASLLIIENKILFKEDK